MSLEATKYVYDHYLTREDLLSRENVVLRHLANRANKKNHHQAWPSVGEIARYTSLSDRSVQRALQGLVSKGMIFIVRQGGIKGDRRDSTSYGITGVTVSPGSRHGVTPPVTQRRRPVTWSPEPSAALAESGESAVTRSHPKVQDERKEKREVKGSQGSATASRLVADTKDDMPVVDA